MLNAKMIGNVYATAGVADFASQNSWFNDFVVSSMTRYLNKDWGDLCEEDKQANDEALEFGDRLLAAYIPKEDPSKKIWIITECDRSATTILFPDEY